MTACGVFVFMEHRASRHTCACILGSFRRMAHDSLKVARAPLRLGLAAVSTPSGVGEVAGNDQKTKEINFFPEQAGEVDGCFHLAVEHENSDGPHVSSCPWSDPENTRVPSELNPALQAGQPLG